MKNFEWGNDKIILARKVKEQWRWEYMDCQVLWENYKQKLNKEDVRSWKNESLNLSISKIERRKWIQENFSILNNYIIPSIFIGDSGSCGILYIFFNIIINQLIFVEWKGGTRNNSFMDGFAFTFRLNWTKEIWFSIGSTRWKTTFPSVGVSTDSALISCLKFVSNMYPVYRNQNRYSWATSLLPTQRDAHREAIGCNVKRAGASPPGFQVKHSTLWLLVSSCENRKRMIISFS